MHDKDLYARILNIEAPWHVAALELNEHAEEVVVRVSWRHLDTCEYRTILVAQMPPVLCERHKVQTGGRAVG